MRIGRCKNQHTHNTQLPPQHPHTASLAHSLCGTKRPTTNCMAALTRGLDHQNLGEDDIAAGKIAATIGEAPGGSRPGSPRLCDYTPGNSAASFRLRCTAASMPGCSNPPTSAAGASSRERSHHDARRKAQRGCHNLGSGHAHAEHHTGANRGRRPGAHHLRPGGKGRGRSTGCKRRRECSVDRSMN